MEHGAASRAIYRTQFDKRSDSQTDVDNIVKTEFVTMQLASLVGLRTAPVALARAGGKDVLLIERFDREKMPDGWRRKAMVSALTLFGLDEMLARYASYEELAEIVRHRFDAPKETLRELFERLVFNILYCNTDDQPRRTQSTLAAADSQSIRFRWRARRDFRIASPRRLVFP